MATAPMALTAPEDPLQQKKWGEVAVQTREAALLPAERWPDERIKAIAKAVAPPGVTLPQLAMFLGTCQRYDLDPLIKEIWLVEIDKKIQTLVGRDALMKTALRDPGFEGVVSGVVREGDEFKVTREGREVTVNHVMGQDRGRVVSGYAVAYHRTRTPTVFLRDVDAYKHLSSKKIWVAYFEDMLETRCIAGCLRRMFVLSGIYTQAEFELKDDDTPEDIAGSQRARKATAESAHNLLDVMQKRQLNVKLDVKQEPEQEPEPEEDEIPEAEVIEILHEEADAANLAQIRRLFWVIWNEDCPVEDPKSDVERKEWQLKVTGKHSQKQWTTSDYRLAIAALEAAR